MNSNYSIHHIRKCAKTTTLKWICCKNQSWIPYQVILRVLYRANLLGSTLRMFLRIHICFTGFEENWRSCKRTNNINIEWIGGMLTVDLYFMAVFQAFLPEICHFILYLPPKKCCVATTQGGENSNKVFWVRLCWTGSIAIFIWTCLIDAVWLWEDSENFKLIQNQRNYAHFKGR